MGKAAKRKRQEEKRRGSKASSVGGGDAPKSIEDLSTQKIPKRVTVKPVTQTPRKEVKIEKERTKRDNFFLLIVAILLRNIVSEYSHLFKDRVELNSIAYSSEYLRDGIAMIIDGVRPWAFGNFHFSPITVFAFGTLSHVESLIVPLWCLIDVGTARNLYTAVRYATRKESVADLVYWMYLYNPITILSTGIASLTVVQNFVCSLIVMNFVCGSPVFCAFLIGAWSSFTVYPAILLSSLVFRCNQSIPRFVSFIIIALLAFITISGFNYIIFGYRWEFLNDIYVPILTFSNIQPNVGLYWYFFVQIFEHFRSFYAIAFTVLYFFLPIPITFNIRNDGVLHFIIMLLLSSILFPYPTLNQMSVVFAILPLVEGYKQYFRYPLVIFGTIVSSMVLMPVMWHMWIVSSSGNANFFFGTTLFYNVALIYLTLELVSAYGMRQMDKDYGASWNSVGNPKLVFKFF